MADGGSFLGSKPPPPLLHGFMEQAKEARWSVLIAVLASLMLAGLWLVATPSAYTAVMVVAPTPKGAVASRGLRPQEVWDALAPVDLVQHTENEPLSDFSRFVHLLTSVPVAGQLAKDGELVKRVFGHDRYAQDAYALAEVLRREVSVTMVGTTPMRRVTFRHSDRAAALQLLTALHTAADDLLRERARKRAMVQVEHIRDRLAHVSANDHRIALVQQLAEQERALMMIAVEGAFAADILEAPAAPLNPDWPRSMLVLAVAAFAGVVVGTLWAAIRSAWRAEKKALRRAH